MRVLVIFTPEIFGRDIPGSRRRHAAILRMVKLLLDDKIWCLDFQGYARKKTPKVFHSEFTPDLNDLPNNDGWKTRTFLSG